MLHFVPGCVEVGTSLLHFVPGYVEVRHPDATFGTRLCRSVTVPVCVEAGT